MAQVAPTLSPQTLNDLTWSGTLAVTGTSTLTFVNTATMSASGAQLTVGGAGSTVTIPAGSVQGTIRTTAAATVSLTATVPSLTSAHLLR
jgi:hypothetical protein